MRITNRAGLPDAIVQAVKNDGYSRGGADISVTQLIAPPRKVALEILHQENLEEDASERIWSIFGQAIHTILERANQVSIAERRLTTTVEGWTVSGGMDLYDESGVLTDYKTTSVWSIKTGLKAEWEKQLNCYAVILRAHGHAVTELKIVCILRDWSKLEAARDPFYPQAQVVTMDVPLWPDHIAAQYMRERVILHQQARVSLPQCSPEDRWQKPTVWAVMKRGNKRAVKLHFSEIEAQSHASADKAFYVVERPGQETRCLHYCSVAKFCDFAKGLKKPEESEEVPA
jgi:hypothetical protein